MTHSHEFHLPDDTVNIETASWRDLVPLRQLEKVCFPKDAWPLLDLVGVLSMPNVLRLKASKESQMVGFIACDIHRSENIAWIATIGVAPEQRRQGIGELLLREAESRLDVSSVRLSVRASNQDAIRLYQRLGYAQKTTWPAYYADREDAVVMEKWIIPANGL